MRRSLDHQRRGRVADAARRTLGMQPVAVADEAREAIARLAEEDDIRVLLDSLPADQAEAVRGRVVDERSYEEIVERMGLTPAAARKRVSRGLSMLRRKREGGMR